jgi:hypothetical protein
MNEHGGNQTPTSRGGEWWATAESINRRSHVTAPQFDADM